MPKQNTGESGVVAAVAADKRVTLKDVAARAGVDVSTVSRVLSKSREYPEQTRLRIFDAVAKLGYQADPMLRALAAYRDKRTPRQFLGTIAILYIGFDEAEIRESMQREVVRTGVAEAERLGYKVSGFSLLKQSPRQLVRQFKARGVLGILIPPIKSPGYRLEMDLRAFSVMRIGYTLEFPEVNMVSPSQFLNMRLLMRHLREIGYRRIGFWLPRPIDDRCFGSLSAGYLRETVAVPDAERVPIGLPEGWESGPFLKWMRQHQPDVVIGLEQPFTQWLEQTGVPLVPFVMPARLGEGPQSSPHIDENWGLIYQTAFQQLDRMIRHGEKGIPEVCQRIVIRGTLKPGIKATLG